MPSIQEGKRMLRAVAGGGGRTPLTIMLWGPPGIGKTHSIEQAAREAGIGFKAVVAHLYQPVDVLGMPYVAEGKTEYAPPTVFPMPGDGERGIFFIDELPNAVPAMQSAWAIIILERSTKHFRFPPGWTIACAGNRATDRAGSSRLISALENRLTHIDIDPDRDEWLSYGLGNGIHPTILAFIEERPDTLIKFDPRSADRAFPSPRSWERASDIMKLDIGESERGAMLSGTIGHGTAVEFREFSRVWKDLPRLADLIAGKVDLSQYGDRPDIMRAIAYSLLAWLAEDPSPERVGAVAHIGVTMPQQEWGSLLIQRLWQMPPNLNVASTLVKSKDFKAISAKFGKFIT